MTEIKYPKGMVWNRAKTNKMLQFEKETGKNAVYNNKITGGFEYWLYWKKGKQKKQKANISITPKLEKSMLMLKFEKETGKNAIHNGKITGQFNSWLKEEEYSDYLLSKAKKTKPKPKKRAKPKPKAKPKPRAKMYYTPVPEKLDDKYHEDYLYFKSMKYDLEHGARFPPHKKKEYEDLLKRFGKLDDI